MNSVDNNDTMNDDAEASITEEAPQAQPVVSLLEKYSSLHRKIDEARTAYSQRQLEIETVEGEIHQLIDVNRIEDRRAIETAIAEKAELLETLQALTSTDLVEAQEAEFVAKSNFESVRFREEKTMRIEQDDRNRFLNASKTFREKIKTLCLRGKLFGVEPPLALLSVHKTLHGSIPSQAAQMPSAEDKENDVLDSLLTDASLLLGDGITGNSIDDADYQDEMNDLLEQLKAQNESNAKKQKHLDEMKEKHRLLVETKEKREKQKKDLESQCERLQKDVRDVESQIEALNEQTREVIELTKQFQNENEKRPGGGTSTTNDGATRSKKKASAPYNPYARVHRRKNTNKESSEATSTANASSTTTARMISPLPETSNNPSPHSSEKRKAKRRANGRRSNTPPSSLIKRHKQTHNRSKRGRPSRRFGESSFRAPREQSLKSSSGLSSNENDQVTREQKKQRQSSVLKDLEDTDEDEDDLSLLNAMPFSLPKKRFPRGTTTSSTKFT